MAEKTETKSKSAGRSGNGSGWQAQKSASTRRLILDAAIRCFVDFGYAHTTTTRIAQKAGLSRGAMLHHFPSKVDIVRAAVEHLHAKRLNAFRKSVTRIPPEADRVKLAVDAYWRQINHPLYVAFFELAVAARTDPELEAILRPMQEAIDQEWHDTALELFPEWRGDSDAFDLALDLTRCLMEGMAASFARRHSGEADEKLLVYLESCLRDLSPQYREAAAGMDTS